MNGSQLSADQLERLSQIRCWLLDMDGTISLGEEALPGALPFFAALQGREYIFLTNNSSHSADHYVRRLQKMGIQATRREVMTSTDALAALLHQIGPQDRPVRIYVVGTPGFVADLRSAGFAIITEREQSIDYVLLGFDTTLTYEKLDIACDYIRRGTPYYAANPDRVCPLADGRVLPDCGALIAFMETCTGRPPCRIIGKPDPAMAEMVMASRGYQPAELAMVGDRLYTDIAFARHAGILGIAVLSGETSLAEITASQTKPDLIFQDVGELARIINP